MIPKKSQVRVLKLRSGEEVIAKVISKTRTGVVLERPMLIIKDVDINPFNGIKRQSICFTNWLESIEIKITIPKNFIIAELTPEIDLAKLYELQKESQDKQNATNLGSKTIVPARGKPNTTPKPPHSDVSSFTKEELAGMDDLMKSMGLPSFEEMNSPPGNMIPNPFQKKQGVSFTIMIPQEIMEEWVETGVFEYLQQCASDLFGGPVIPFGNPIPKQKKKKAPPAKKISKAPWKEPTPDQTKKPTFGNSPVDWSPFLKDYMNDGPTGPVEPKE